MPVVSACSHQGGGRCPRRWPQARVAPGERALSSCALPRDALVELKVRHGLRVGIDCVRSSVLHRPQRRPPRWPQTRWRSRFTQMTGNLLDHRGLGDEGDDLHRAAALRAQQRRQRIDASAQACPDVARRLAMCRLCRRRIRRDRFDQRRCKGNFSGMGQCGDSIS